MPIFVKNLLILKIQSAKFWGRFIIFSLYLGRLIFNLCDVEYDDACVVMCDIMRDNVDGNAMKVVVQNSIVRK